MKYRSFAVVALAALALAVLPAAAVAQTETVVPGVTPVVQSGTNPGVITPGAFDLTFIGQGQEASAVWLPGKRELKYGFEMEVDFSIDSLQHWGQIGNIGADGITVCFQLDRQDAIGGVGQGLGAYRNVEFGGPAISNAFAVEVDTFSNINDGVGPHISVQGMYLTGELSGENAQSIIEPITIPAPFGFHKLRIVYREGVMSIFLDCNLVVSRPMTWPLASTDVWVGVTGATGGAALANGQRINRITLTRDTARSDINRDGVINIDDVFIFLSLWNNRQ